MRRFESVVLAFVVGLLGVGVWRAQPLLPAWDSKPEAVHPAASAMTGGVVWVKGTRDVAGNTTSFHDAIRPSAPHTTAVLRTRADSGGTTVVPVPWIITSSIPRAGEMIKGATGSQLRTKFGDPMLETALVREGRLIQRFYYFNSDQTQFTVANLENGRVVAVEGGAR